MKLSETSILLFFKTWNTLYVNQCVCVSNDEEYINRQNTFNQCWLIRKMLLRNIWMEHFLCVYMNMKYSNSVIEWIFYTSSEVG